MKVTDWCRACVWLALAGASLTKTNLTHAEQPRYRVELHAPKFLPNCSDLQGFVEELDLALGHSLLDEANAARVLDVRIERPIGSDFAVDVAIADVDGRILHKQSTTYAGSTECFKVLHKSAFIAAMLMEKDVQDEPKPAATPQSSPPPPPPPAPPKCPEVKVEPPRSAETSSRRRAFVGIGVGAFLNVAPEAFFSPYVQVGWYARPRVVFELDATGQGWTTTRPQDGPTILDVRTALATLTSCYVLGAFMACGLASVEVRHASGFAQANSISETRVLPQLGARASFDHRLVRSLSVRTNIDGLLYPSTRRIDGGSDTLWRPIPLALGVTTSLVWTF